MMEQKLFSTQSTLQSLKVIKTMCFAFYSVPNYSFVICLFITQLDNKQIC